MVTRVYLSQFESSAVTQLSNLSHHHVSRVLRKSQGDKLVLFDGEGGYAEASIVRIDKRSTQVEIGEKRYLKRPESPKITLCQALAKGERMEYAIQKSVELGVAEISPMITERVNVRLGLKRLEHKLERWRQIIISACEQSGQNWLPHLNPPVMLDEHCEQVACSNRLGLILSPSGRSIDSLRITESITNFSIYVGPEGGFTPEEVGKAESKGFAVWRLGSLIMRTETACIAALSLLQHKLGVF